MYAKNFVLGFFMMIIFLPITSPAQTHTATSVEDIKNSAPDGSIVLISKEESDNPEYIHAKYVFAHPGCDARLVDYYGRPIDPNNRDLKQTEQRMCMEIAMDSRDGE